MSVYTELVEAGVEVSSHASDLYFPATPFTEALVRANPELGFVVFHDRVTNKPAFELPFGYDPYWEKRDMKCN